MITDAFAYPLRGSGRILLIIGTLLSAALDFASSAWFIGFAAWAIGGAYFVAYYFDIIVTTVSGRDEPPDFPDITDLYGDILAPLLRSLAALIIAHLPLMVLAGIYWEEKSWPAHWQWLCLGFAAFYFPMAILNVAVSDEAAGALPHRVLPDAIRAMPRYLILVLLLVAVYAVEQMASSLRIPIVGGLISAGVSLYFVMVQARMAGMFYRQSLEEEDPEEKAGAGAAPPDESPAEAGAGEEQAA